MSPTIADITSHFQDVLETTGPTVSRAYLFGSQARDEAHQDSDIDIAIIDEMFADTPMHKRGHWFKREWDYLTIGPLELYCLTPDEYETRLEHKQETVSNIDSEGILLTEHESES